jgi:hypothetical protein
VSTHFHRCPDPACRELVARLRQEIDELHDLLNARDCEIDRLTGRNWQLEAAVDDMTRRRK